MPLAGGDSVINIDAAAQTGTGQAFRWLRRILLSVLGCVLLLAAAVKALELASGPVAQKTWPSTRWMLSALVEMELLLGLWLISGLYSRAAWTAAVASFAAFTVISGYQAWIGHTSCGCFGRIAVHPWYMAALDAVAVTALLFSGPPEPLPSPSRRRLLLFAALAVPLAVAGAAMMLRDDSVKMIAEGETAVADGVIVLEPQMWLGKPFPLIRHIDVGDRLKSGQWLVLLYDSRCSTCHEAVGRYQQFAHAMQSHKPDMRVALIEIPPNAAPSESPASAVSACLRGTLDPQHEWFASVPLAVMLRDGHVVACADGGRATDPLNREAWSKN